MIAKDAGETIAASLKSAAFADELIVVENGSTDDTRKIASRHATKVVTGTMDGFGAAKNRAIALARGRWILNLDADENIPSSLRKEIERIVKDDGPLTAYEMPRKNHYFGRWLRHGGKYPDRQLRLFKRGQARFHERLVHERLAVGGRIGRLTHPLDHFPYRDLASFVAKAELYAGLEAEAMRRAGVRPGFTTAFRHLLWLPASRFVRRYVFKLGFLDGLPGLLACLHDAATRVLVYAHLAMPARPDPKI